MKTRTQLIAASILTLAFGGAVLAANMTEAQIKEAAMKVDPGAKIEQAKLEKTGGHELWNVKVKGKDGKETTLYFNQAGDHVDAMGKAV
jgi:hypothetical protein